MKILTRFAIAIAIPAVLLGCHAPDYTKEPGVLISKQADGSCTLSIDRADGSPVQLVKATSCNVMADRSLQVQILGCGSLVAESFTYSGPIDGFLCVSCGHLDAQPAGCRLNISELPESWAFQ